MAPSGTLRCTDVIAIASNRSQPVGPQDQLPRPDRLRELHRPTPSLSNQTFALLNCFSRGLQETRKWVNRYHGKLQHNIAERPFTRWTNRKYRTGQGPVGAKGGLQSSWCSSSESVVVLWPGLLLRLHRCRKRNPPQDSRHDLHQHNQSFRRKAPHTHNLQLQKSKSPGCSDGPQPKMAGRRNGGRHDSLRQF